MLYRHLQNPTFIVSAIDDAQAEDAKVLENYGELHFEKVTQPAVPVPEGNHHLHAPYSISVPPAAVLGQLWAFQRAWEFACESVCVDDFGLFVRTRADLHFHSFEPQGLEEIDSCDALTPWWGRFGGVNDRLAIMGRGAAHAYFNTLGFLDTLIADGAPLHPESLVLASLEWCSMYVYADLLAMFSTVRLDGTIRPPEVTHEDIAALSLGHRRRF